MKDGFWIHAKSLWFSIYNFLRPQSIFSLDVVNMLELKCVKITAARNKASHKASGPSHKGEKTAESKSANTK